MDELGIAVGDTDTGEAVDIGETLEIGEAVDIGDAVDIGEAVDTAGWRVTGAAEVGGATWSACGVRPILPKLWDLRYILAVVVVPTIMSQFDPDMVISLSMNFSL